MTRSRANKGWLVVIAALTVAALATWVWSWRRDTLIESIANLLFFVIPAGVALYHEAKKHSLAVFLFAARTKSIFVNPLISWQLSTNLQGSDITKETIAQITDRFLAKSSRDYRVEVTKVNSFRSQVVIDPGPTLDISFIPITPTHNDLDSDVDAASLRILIKNYRIGYRQAAHVIEKEVMPALEEVVDLVKPDRKAFSLTINYDKAKNPFFGFYVANLPPEVVSKFTIVLNLDAVRKGDTARISENKLTINSTSHTNLTSLALEFLAFNDSLREELGNA